jgi:hypothetical protein
VFDNPKSSSGGGGMNPLSLLSLVGFVVLHVMRYQRTKSRYGARCEAYN